LAGFEVITYGRFSGDHRGMHPSLDDQISNSYAYLTSIVDLHRSPAVNPKPSGKPKGGLMQLLTDEVRAALPALYTQEHA
jgi:hypothetical protein